VELVEIVIIVCANIRLSGDIRKYQFGNASFILLY